MQGRENILVDMRPVVAQHGVRGLDKMGSQGNLVGHGPGRHK
jgi:hypothetical protein